MLLLFKIVIAIMLIFLALGLACAIWFTSRREHGIGLRGVQHPTAADPYAFPFGDVPYTGFTERQLNSVAPARKVSDPLNRTLGISPSAELPPSRNDAGGRPNPIPSWTAAGRSSRGDAVAIAVFGPIGVAILGALLLAGFFQ